VFLQSGVETVIGSGWPVPDEVAARTAREFYAHLLPAGPAEALRRAHRALRETDYWSSFRIQGR
jgi:CHAT domain-containing protein